MNRLYTHCMCKIQKPLFALVLVILAALVAPAEGLASAKTSGKFVSGVFLAIQGTVTDAGDGSPLVGANVLIRGTTTGTITDTEGKFALDAGPEDVLVISFIGYLTQEVVIGNRSQIDISLETNSTSLGE